VLVKVLLARLAKRAHSAALKCKPKEICRCVRLWNAPHKPNCRMGVFIGFMRIDNGINTV
jgi:hypothetical protein